MENDKLEKVKKLFESSPELVEMWHRLHTPLVREHRKVGRNEICPFCDSGKKFKHCECYAKYKTTYKNMESNS